MVLYKFRMSDNFMRAANIISELMKTYGKLIMRYTLFYKMKTISKVIRVG